MRRRDFMTCFAVGAGLSCASPPRASGCETPAEVAGDPPVPSATTQVRRDGFFTLVQAHGRTWLMKPDGGLFLTLGKNHIDPASLRYPESGRIWRERYGNSMRRWLQEKVRPDLLAWGFNSVGWNQDMASNGETNHRQSRLFTFDEYQWLDMPYAPMLPFADFHHWDAQHRMPDFSAPEFADWCDYVAREYVAPFADDPKLIGYFYVDCPTWVHTHPHSRWRGPLFDHRQLESEEGRARLTDLATSYYRTLHDAIRRYDPHHLILGDRYEARGRMAVEVLRAAAPYIDVLSFQHFGSIEQVIVDLNRWAETIGKPVLLADSYSGNLSLFQQVPSCIGYHACGSYLKNKVRGGAMLDSQEAPIGDSVEKAKSTNLAISAWVDSFRS